MKKIRVAVNGYGVIGTRIADAVRKQKDMMLVGVADVVMICPPAVKPPFKFPYAD